MAKKATEYEHCAKARQILSSMAPTIAKAKGTADRQAATQALVAEYIRRNFSINQQTWEEATPFQKKDYTDRGLAECVLQLHSVNEVGEEAKAQRGSDFNKMIKTERSIIKIQSMFRQKLAVRRLEKDVEKQKARLAKKQNKQRNVSSEEVALQELKSRLKKKGLTPEAFFRVCDIEMKKSIPVDRFKSMLNNFKLELSRGQISRLALILDEDMEGNITLEEYYHALEAYGQYGEDHSAIDGSGYYVPFEHKAVFKLLQILKDRGITPDELFRSCDVDNSGDMNIQELETVLQGISAEFYQKDCQAIHNFFDIDKNNKSSEAEFMGQIKKAERLFQQHKQRLAGNKTMAASLRSEGLNDRDGGMSEFISGWYDMTPAQQTEKLTEYMIQLFKQRNFSPARVHAMADTMSTGNVKISSLLTTLGKLMPNLTKEFLDHIPAAHGMSLDTSVSKEEWMIMFDYKSVTKDVGPKPSAAKRLNQSKNRKADEQQNQVVLKYLCEQMQKENLTPQRLFRSVDRDWSGVVDINEMKEQIKLLLPDMQTINLKKLMNALDVNGNGIVEEEEFKYLLDEASKSTADTAEFNKISDKLLGSNKKQNYNDHLQKKKTVKMESGSVGVSLDQTVALEDRVTHEQVYECFKELHELEKSIEEPVDEIQAIFEKIKEWKQKAGDLEEQETMVHNALKPKKKIKIHNYNTLMTKLSELQAAIGLTDTEIKIIIFSSLDHDYLTNMIVAQAEFLQWFTINFEGEGGEELDFLAGLNNNWTAACVHAMDIIQRYKLLKNNHDVIFTERWWSKLRFNHFGSEVKREFESKPSEMKEMRELFRVQNDKLSYYDFFQFIQKKLEIKLEGWEEDALEMRLDRLGMAFIEFNEFNEFCQTYDINWGEPLLENDLEEILEAKINQSYRDYKVTSNDYFMGCPTMLNNEKAALQVARSIYKNLKKQKKDKFLDQDFGPKDKADLKGHAFALYQEGEIPQKGYVEPNDIEWVYAEELCDPGEFPQFLDDSAAAEDCTQGELGDCWLISAMASIAQRDELIVGGKSGLEYDPDMIVDKEIAVCLSKGTFPPIFHKYRAKGLYVLRIFKNFNWIYVIVDERLPCKKAQTGKSKVPVFGHCRSPHEMWVALLEKAYAKMHGCYGNLISGYIDEGIQELTGFQPEKILIRNEQNGMFPHKMIHHYVDEGQDLEVGFFKFLVERKEDQCLMGCSIKGYGKKGELIIDGTPTGLILDHAYTLQDVIEIPDPFDKDIPLRILRLRNPWGHDEWKGEWSEGSKNYVKYKEQLKDYIETLPPDEQIDLDNPKNDGSFFIGYEDWKDIFSTLFINLDFPDKWTGVRFDSQWTECNSPGLPTTNTADAKSKYAQNPQFMIKPAKDTEMLVSMSQTGGRLPIKKGGKNQYYKYPFVETLNYACLAVFKVEPHEKHLKMFDKQKLVYLSPVKRERENTGRVKLTGGQSYIMVPSCEVEGTLGDVFLNLYINQPLRDCLIKRVFHPMDKNLANDEVLPKFIPEEAEKVQVAPTWKLELVREMLPFMITEEDELKGARDWGDKCQTD